MNKLRPSNKINPKVEEKENKKSENKFKMIQETDDINNNNSISPAAVTIDLNNKNEKKINNKIKVSIPDSGYFIKVPKNDVTVDTKMSRWARIKFKHFDDEFSDKKDKFTGCSIQTRKLNMKLKFFLKKIEKLDPWYKSFKYIERTYGLSYLSFFKFIQWLFLFNLFISIIAIIFVIFPQFTYTNEKLPTNYTYIEANNLTISEACPSLFSNYSSLMIANNIETEKLITECCSDDYKRHLEMQVNKETTWEKFLDFIQGTGFMEDTLLFYGHYNNRTVLEVDNENTEKIKHVYYMGFAFVSVALISLLISAILILIRLGKGFKTGIIKSSDSKSGSELCKQIFCSWDYHISNKKMAKKTQDTIAKYLNEEVEEIKRKLKEKELNFSDKISIYFIRFLVFTFLLIIYAASGVGIYYLNDLSLKQLATASSDLEKLLYEFLPAIGIKSLNIIFPLVCKKLATFEKYNIQQTLSFYLIRTGFVRLGSLIFLFVSITNNIFKNEGFCSSQANTQLSEVIFSDTTTPFRNSTIKCWETYVGQQFYKLVILDFITQILQTFIIEVILDKLTNCFKNLNFFKVEFDLGIRFLDILYIQTIFWSSFFFSPILSVIATIYYFLLFYLKLFSLRFNCKKSGNNEMQSRSNVAFFLVLFLVFLFILITAGLIFSAVKPSRSCGPFRLHDSAEFYIYTKIRDELNNNAPQLIKYIFNIVFSYLFILLASCVLLVIIWILYNYSKAYVAMADTFRKIITEERNKNNALLREVIKLENKLSKKNREYRESVKF